MAAFFRFVSVLSFFTCWPPNTAQYRSPVPTVRTIPMDPEKGGEKMSSVRILGFLRG
jgi:hypothetical protein